MTLDVRLIAGFCAFFAILCPAQPSDWPQWRGPERTGRTAAAEAAPAALPKDLKPLWKLAIGGGFSSPVVAAGKLVYLDENGSREGIHVLEAATGRELWGVFFADRYQDEWGAGPRSTPLIDQDRVYAQSCNGELRCFRLADGQVLWGASFEKDFGVKFLGSKASEGTASRRGNNGSGVIDGERFMVPVGNTDGASLVCFHKLTGQVLWKSGSDEAAYSSFMTATLAGVKQVVAFTADALLGSRFETGEILWRVPLVTNAKRHAATPIILGDRVIVNSHSIGLVCFRIVRQNGALTAQKEWVNKALAINLSTPVLVGDCLYSLGAKKDYVCVEAATGKLRWSQPGFGRGPKDNASTIAVGAKLLVLTEPGELVLLEANPDRCVELGRLQVCGSTWTHPAYANGKLFVRDPRQLLCLDLLAPVVRP
jgi:outer membrane protein assembly factor BamB